MNNQKSIRRFPIIIAGAALLAAVLYILTFPPGSVDNGKPDTDRLVRPAPEKPVPKSSPSEPERKTPETPVAKPPASKAEPRKESQSIADLLAVVMDSEESLRMKKNALRALAAKKTPDAGKVVPRLTEYLEKKAPAELKPALAFAIAEIGTADAAECAPVLILLLKKRDMDRGIFQLALRKICNESPQALEYLGEALKHDDPQIRKYVVETFSGIECKKMMHLLPSITDALGSDPTRKQALKTLVTLGKKSKDIRDKLYTAFEKQKNYTAKEWMIEVFKRIRTADMLETLVGIVKFGSNPMKENAAAALKDLEDISVLPELQTALKEESNMRVKKTILKTVNRLIEIKMDRDFKKAMEERKKEMEKKKEETEK